MSNLYIGDVLSIERFDSIDSWRGLYTLGIISNPIWLTVSSQQNRAADIALSFIREIAIKSTQLKRSDQRIRVGIIGAGVGGMTLAYCLHSFRIPNQKFSLSVDVFEKHSGICPIQRGSHTRRLHPTLQYWPDASRHPYYYIKQLASTPTHSALRWTGGITAGDLASKISKEYFENFGFYAKSGRKNILSVYEGCGYLLVKKSESGYYDITLQGHKIIDSLGTSEPISRIIENYDAIFFATGFGVERAFEKNGVHHESTPYWRNDSLGQFNLNDEPHRYLISGNGDGAVSDVLRAIIVDYKPDELLSAIFGAQVSELISKSFNISKKHTNSTLENLQICLRHFIGVDLLQTAKSHDVLSELHKMWNISKQHKPPYVGVWKHADSPLKMISKVLVWPRIKKNVEVIVHLKDSAELGEIINNPAVTFYNRFLFYVVWAAGKITLKTGDLLDVAKRHQIKPSSMIIRHGADSRAPIRGVLSEDLYSAFERRKSAKITLKDISLAKDLENYRKGLRVT